MKFYVLTNYGEVVFWTTVKDDAEFEFRNMIDEKICNFYRNQLPIKVTTEIRERFGDMTIHEIDTDRSGKMLVSELQEHFDRFYREQQEQKQLDKENEWKRAQELYIKYRTRLETWAVQQEGTKSGFKKDD